MPPHLEAFVSDIVSAGRYQSASEVVRIALLMLEAQERQRAVNMERLRQEIRKGFDSGTAVPLDIDVLLQECHAAHKKHNGG